MDATLFSALEKVAVTRSVQEWRAAQQAGNQNRADAIARASGQLGLKPRYLEDVSLGGAEAGVDKMMGSAAAQPAASPNFQQRLEQYKANKAQLGVDGRAPTQSVKASPEGRAALLRGTQAPAQAAAPNESGYLARKLYKPDSDISRGEFTPQLLAQKQQITDQARALSPEAKNLVPAMYGHQTMGTGPLQRSTSFHEYVPGVSDLRGKNIGAAGGREVWSNMPGARSQLANIQQTVLNPMHARGMTMADTISSTGTNYGNVVQTAHGPKILDFLPDVAGQKNPAAESFRTYAPEGSQFVEGGAKGSLGELRKEVFNPQMRINPASGPAQMRAAAILRGENPAPLASGSANSVATSRPGASALATSRPGSAVAATAAPRRLPTSGVQPAAGLAHAPTAPALNSLAHAPTLPSAAGASALHLPTVRPGALAGAAGKLESAAARTAPGFLRRAGTALSHFH